MTPMPGVLDWLCVGDVAVESVEGTPGTILAGGAARLAAHGAALGARVALVGKIGADDAGRRVRESLERVRVDLRWLRSGAGMTTTVWHEVPGHPQSRRLDRGADSALRLDELPSSKEATAPLTIVSGYSLSAEPARSAIYGALTAARSRGAKGCLLLEAELLWWTNARMARRVLEPAIAAAHSVALGAADAAILFGPRSDLRQALDELAAMGPKVVYLQAEDGGALLREAGRRHQCRPEERLGPPRDRFAAPAAFWVGLLRGTPLRQAATEAVRYAQSVRKPGAPVRAR